MENKIIQPAEQLEAFKKTIKHEIDKIQRKLGKQEEELAESVKHTWYTQIGDSLLTYPSSVKRGQAKAEIINIHTEQIEMVSLNPKFDAKQNAELLYKKAKKGKRSAEICAEKVLETKEELSRLKQLLLKIEQLAPENLNDVVFESLAKSLPTQISAGILAGAPAQQAAKVPYRHYTIDEWEIYIGKNNTQNDEISTRFARPSDVWLHVAGHAGSHVVIRRPKGSEPPPREIIEKTAAMAVWFSKAKHTSYAEVHVTEARFVHKRRHSAPGEVIAERCKSVRVSPKSPHDLFPSMYGIEKDDE